MVRLTRMQTEIAEDLASGLDIAAIAEKRGKSLSATYEIVKRIRVRLGVDRWQDIAQTAVEHGLIQQKTPKSADPGSIRPKNPEYT